MLRLKKSLVSMNIFPVSKRFKIAVLLKVPSNIGNDLIEALLSFDLQYKFISVRLVSQVMTEWNKKLVD
jgi:hypothetical protein